MYDRDDPVGDAPPRPGDATLLKLKGEMLRVLDPYGKRKAARLGLDPGPEREVQVENFNTVFRVGRDGQLRIEPVAQFCQRAESLEDETGGLEVWGGTTLVAAADGTIRYAIVKLLPSERIAPRYDEAGRARLTPVREFVREFELADPRFAWGTPTQQKRFMARLKSLAAVHLGA